MDRRMVEEFATTHRSRPGKLRRLLVGSFLIILVCFFFLALYHIEPVVQLGRNRVKPQIAVCADRVVLLAPDGSLWTWGRSLGKITKPHRLGTDSDWNTVAGSASAVIATKTNGSLWRFEAFQTPPRQLYPGTTWRAVAANQKEMAALTTDGAIWAAGESPVQLGQETNWLTLAGGSLHMAAVRTDGSLWVWGEFYPPGTALGLTRFGSESNWSEVCSAGYELMARKRDGTCWMGGSSTPWLANLLALQRPLGWGEVTRIKEVEDWHSVTFGSCALGLGHDGTLRGFGLNYGRLLGSGPFGVRKGPIQIGKRRDWVAVGTAGWVAVGLTADGTVWAWGKRVDKVDFLAKMKQRIAPVLGRLGIKINTATPDVISSQPTPILRFHLQ
jgi:alpha-tubulin suppressor-like RCC1 family protein